MFEMDWETEQLYQQAKAIVRLVEDNMRLQHQCERLQQELDKENALKQEMYNNNIAWAGNLLGKLVHKADEEVGQV